MSLEASYRALVATIESAGAVAREYFHSDDLSNDQKADGSVVTRVDTSIERALRTFIAEHFPHDAVIGEEEAKTDGTSGYVWHIDPIDGTDNFLRKIPFCGISVARLGDTAEGSLAIVHNPITQHTFASLMDNGVYENERIIALTPEPLGGRYVISTAFGAEPWMRAAKYPLSAALEAAFGRVKSFSCSALQTAYLSSGRFDAHVTCGLHSWDYAAGLHLAHVAGGVTSVFEDGVWTRWEKSNKELFAVHGRTMVTSHPAVHNKILAVIGDPHQWAS